MNYNRANNIIINMPNQKRVRNGGNDPEGNLVRLAAYYTAVFTDTVERMHMSEEQKKAAVSAVNMEYGEILTSCRCVDMVS